MTEYIKKEDLVKWIEKNLHTEYYKTDDMVEEASYTYVETWDLLQYLDKASVDGELIKGRCKDCDTLTDMGDGTFHCPIMDGVNIKPDSYCSEWEPKEE